MQVIALQDIPELDHQRQELVALLGGNQARLTQLLSSNQQQLATNLDQLVKDSKQSSDS